MPVLPFHLRLQSPGLNRLVGWLWSAFAGAVMARAVESPGVLWGPVYNDANGHSYYLLSQSLWSEAHEAAARLGGHLASINDREECLWVYHHLCFAGGVARPLWIGLTDRDHEGLFRWTNGEPIAFSNWAAGEPNNNAGLGTPENYAFIFPTTTAYESRWNDANDGALPDWEDIGKWFGSADSQIGAFGLVEVSRKVEGASVPGSETALSIVKSTSTVDISWKTTTGWRYQLQSSAVSGLVSWVNVGDGILGIGTEATVTQPVASADSRFFRLVLSKP